MSIDAHLAALHETFDPAATLPDRDAVVPDHWLDYLCDAPAKRRACLKHELNLLEPYLPELSEGLMQVTTDAFLIQTPERGLCRILVRQIDGGTYYAYSRSPTNVSTPTESPAYRLFKAHGPRCLPWMYENLMDGLTDIYDFVGFLASDRLELMSEDYPNFDFPWYNDFAAKHDTDKIVHFFSSGGGAHMLLNLNENMHDVYEPQALRVSSKEEDWVPENTVDLWPTLDAWMFIGLAEDDAALAREELFDRDNFGFIRTLLMNFWRRLRGG